MDLTSFETREALQEWIDEQDEPEEVTEELSDQLQGDELQGTPAQWVVYEAPSLMDGFPMGGVVQPETLDKRGMCMTKTEKKVRRRGRRSPESCL